MNDAAAITIYTLVKNLIEEATRENAPVLQETRATLLGVNAGQCAQAARFLIQTKITAIYLLQFVLKTIAAAVLIGESERVLLVPHGALSPRLSDGSHHYSRALPDRSG